jgi:hypothetical protein
MPRHVPLEKWPELQNQLKIEFPSYLVGEH